MDRTELLKFHTSVCEDARNLMSLKNRDYAGNGGSEPFANFTRCESMGVCQTEAGILVRVIDKISRMSSFLESGKMHVEDESFYDSMIDVINYMVLLGGYVKDKDNSKPEEDLAPNETLSAYDRSVEIKSFDHKVVKLPSGPTSTVFDDETKDLPPNTVAHHPV